MLFSSLTFLYFFLPAVTILYLVFPGSWKNGLLLMASLFFYAWGEPGCVVCMAVVILQAYIFGLLVEKFKGTARGKRMTAVSVAISLGILVFFKYAVFFVEIFSKITGISIALPQIVLPIGISFYIFQTISYILDVGRGTVRAQKNVFSLALYISMFPQLIAGPIVRYSDMEGQLGRRTHSLEKTAGGISRFVLGLGKKVIIANTLGEFTRSVSGGEEPSVLSAWLYAFAAALQIYYDFSGYSDMAIGLGKMFGFDFPENFDYPFISKSVTEFWRRWHMSLSGWFRDYLYIPLGGNRVAFPRYIFNILIVWTATGLWHGAAWNFVVWGLYFAVFLILEKVWAGKMWRKSDKSFGSRAYLLAVTGISFVIFYENSLREAFDRIGMMFGRGVPVISHQGLYFFRDYAGVMAIASVGATPFLRDLVAAVKRHRAGEKVISLLEPVVLAAVFLTATSFLVNDSYHPFLYFRF